MDNLTVGMVSVKTGNPQGPLPEFDKPIRYIQNQKHVMPPEWQGVGGANDGKEFVIADPTPADPTTPPSTARPTTSTTENPHSRPKRSADVATATETPKEDDDENDSTWAVKKTGNTPALGGSISFVLILTMAPGVFMNRI